MGTEAAKGRSRTGRPNFKNNEQVKAIVQNAYNLGYYDGQAARKKKKALELAPVAEPKP